MTPWKAAARYAELGWLVIPLHSVDEDGLCSCRTPNCKAPGKHPRIKDWVQRGSAEAPVLDQWRDEWPEANIGIVTGGDSGLLVLDVDGRTGEESLRILEDEYGQVPPTVEVQTGRGRHFYFRAPVSAIRSRNHLRKGMDIRADGGMVVAPPSRHASGTHYRFVDGCAPGQIEVARAPTWLLDLLRTPTTGRELGPLPKDTVLAPRLLIPEGERNSTLHRMGSAMRGTGFDEVTILAALQAHNKASCVPPLGDSEVMQIAWSCSQYPPEAPREGGIFLPRAVERQLRRRPNEHRLFLYLLCRATWRPEERGARDLGVGEVCLSYRSVSDACEWDENNRVERWSPSRVKQMIGSLEAQGLIQVLRTRPQTVVKVVNYEQFRGIPTGRSFLNNMGSEQLGTPQEGGQGTPPHLPFAPRSLAQATSNGTARNTPQRHLRTQ